MLSNASTVESTAKQMAPPPVTEVVVDELGDGCAASFFEEKSEVLGLINRIATLTLQPGELTPEEKRILSEGRWSRLPLIFERYQEQPGLLDPHLEELVHAAAEPLRTAMDNVTGHIDGLDALFNLLYVLCKVRGYKTVVRFLTHEAKDLEPTLAQLRSTPATPQYWPTRYILLLWLSLIVMTPFDLATIDSSLDTRVQSSGQQLGLVDTLVMQGKQFLSSTGKEYEGAAILLTRLLTRRDTVETHLTPFLNWCIEEALRVHSEALPMNVFLLRGILYALCTLYKLGPRHLLLPTLSKIIPLSNTLAEGSIATTNSLIRKLIVKLTQRIGLCFLKPKLAKWRYQRGSRSLAANLGRGPAIVAQGGIGGNDMDDDDEIPEETEEIIQMMLNGLRDKDTIVRWSAAKGVGRISARLPQEFATEIVASVIALFDEDTLPPVAGSTTPNLAAVSDSTWHGACLAVAELARRGLLMPEWLEKVVPWISLALLFDMKRGSHSIGAHVRDAGNYVCWSFFRAYDPALLLPHISTLSRRLIVSATLDREVNVRRAASAAFQEGVGRLGGSGEFGAVPNGIDIVTIADYFSVGNRVSSVLEVAVSLANYGDYRADIITHIAQVMTSHWDKAIRILASQALYKLTFIDLDFVLNSVLPDLIPRANSFDLVVRHGACLALGEICLAWSQIRNGSPRQDISDKELTPTWWTKDEEEKFVKPITNIIPTYPQTLLDTFGSDLTRISLCHLIACLSDANWPSQYRVEYGINQTVTYDPFLVSWWSLVHSTLENRDESVQIVAAKAMASLSNYCWPLTLPTQTNTQTLIDTARKSALLKDMVDTICAKTKFIKNPAPTTRIYDRFASTTGKAQQGGNQMVDRFPRRGYALAAGMVSKCGKVVHGTRILESLIALVTAVEGGGEDAEGRRNAVSAIVGVCVGLGVDGICEVIPRTLFTESMDALFIGMEDYSIDSRGDVGSWIREACFKAWPVLLPLFTSVNMAMVAQGKDPYLVPEISARAVKALLRQSVEKIDRVRESAGVALSQVLNLKDVNLGILDSSRDLARIAVQESESGELNWLNTADVYPRMVKLLAVDEFRDDLMVGLVVSVGGISESLVRFSTSSFVEFVNALPLKSQLLDTSLLSLQTMLKDFTALFSKPSYIKDRISVSLIEVTDVLIGCGAVARVVADSDEWISTVSNLFDVVKKEVFKCKDVKKVLAAIKVFIGLAALSGVAAKSIRQKALTQLVVYLTHTYPRVRRASSEGLYIALTTCGEEEQAEFEEKMELIEDVLLTTDWDQPATDLKEYRAKMAEYLNVKLPAVLTKA
ncbi:hypothetical protein HDU79_003644 [Rhizoclosmatium sp. JEL0117]|nr:hypothetical protein HDU79_003644 [Rhizoclosmatium sp. JEL0117]